MLDVITQAEKIRSPVAFVTYTPSTACGSAGVDLAGLENNGDVLTVFLVNQGKIPLLYDDFTVRVEQENPINNGTFYETPGTRNP